MELLVSERGAPDDWDARLCSAGGCVFHSSAWARFLAAERPEAVPQFMSFVEADGTAAGFALGLFSRSTRAALRPFTGRLILDALPAVRTGSEDAFRDVLSVVQGHARSLGATEVFVGSYASPFGSGALQGLGFRLKRRLEFELCLERPESELWEAMESKRRWSVKRAMQHGVVIEDLPPEEGLVELRRLQAASSERIERRGGPRIGLRGALRDDPVRVLLKTGVARIMGAKVGSAVVSAALFTLFNGRVYHHLAGHDEKGLKTQAPTLLYWESIKRYRGEGAQSFNFGGCKAEALDPRSPEHGVYEYKKAFGGSALACASGSKPLRPTARRVLGMLEHISRWMSPA